MPGSPSWVRAGIFCPHRRFMCRILNFPVRGFCLSPHIWMDETQRLCGMHDQFGGHTSRATGREDALTARSPGAYHPVALKPRWSRLLSFSARYRQS